MSTDDAIKARLKTQLAKLLQREDRIRQDLAEPLNADLAEQAILWSSPSIAERERAVGALSKTVRLQKS